MHDVTKLLLVALTVTDVGVGFWGLLSTGLRLHIYVKAIRKAADYSQLLGFCILAMITVVRYIAVSQPLKLQTLVTKRRAYIGLTCAVFLCLAGYVSETITFYTGNPLPRYRYVVHFSVVATLFLCVIILYGKMLLIARHQARRIAAAEINAEDAQVQLQRSNVKSLKTFLIITGTVCVTWLPSFAGLAEPHCSVHAMVDALR